MRNTSKIISIIVGLFCIHFFRTTPVHSYSTGHLDPGRQESQASFPRHDRPFQIVYGIPDYGFGGKLMDAEALNVLLYTNLLEEPRILPMEFKNGTWETTISIADSSVKMILFAFQGRKGEAPETKIEYDDNDGEFWDLLFYDASGKPLMGAHEARAFSYTGLGGRRKENLEKAGKEIEAELEYYPDNFSARSLQYTITLRKTNFSDDSRQSIKKELDALLARSSEDEAVLNFVLGVYRMIGEMEQAQNVEKRLVEINPRGSQAAMKSFNDAMTEDEPEARIESLERFLIEFEGSRFEEFALSNLATTVVELDDTSRMLKAGNRLLSKATTPGSASGLAGIAGALSEKGIELGRAEAYAKKAISIVQASSGLPRPPELSEQDWNERIQTTTARYRNILGWIFFLQGRMNESLEELNYAAEHVSQPDVYYHLGRTLERLNRGDDALVQYARAAIFGGAIGDTAYAYLNQLWTRSTRPEAEMDFFLDEQEEWIESQYRNNVISKRIRRPAPDFELEDISGGWVRLSDQRGSIVLLCFWASWSNSSKLLLQTLDALADEYGREILFLTISTDIEFDVAVDYVDENEIRLPVLYNIDVDKTYGLQGVPTLYVIDTRGNIRYEHKGYRPDIGKIISIELEELLKG